MDTRRDGTAALGARVASIIFALAATILGVYGVVLVYAAATFEGEGPPGSVVLYIVAAGVGLGALLCAGLAHVLRRTGKRRP